MTIEAIDLNKDIEAIENIIQLSFSETPDSTISDWFSIPEMVKSITENRGQCMKALNNYGKIIGMIHAQQENPINNREGKEKWVITNISVATEETGKGIGGKLLEAIENEARKNQAKKIYVHTNIRDDKVIRFYKKYGYKEAGSIKDYYYAGSAIFLIKYL